MTTHFGVSVPYQMMCFDEPLACPFSPGLRFEGIAVTSDWECHLVIALGDKDRFWLGPNRWTVERRAMILLVGLQLGSDGEIDTFHGSLIQGWVMDAWDAVMNEGAARPVRKAGQSLAARGSGPGASA